MTEARAPLDDVILLVSREDQRELLELIEGAQQSLVTVAGTLAAIEERVARMGAMTRSLRR
jgi:hypothetical protein